MKLKLFDGVRKKAAEVSFEIARKKPELLIGIGITTGVIGCVMACKATLKADDILKEAKDQVKKIEEVSESYPEEYSESAKKKDLSIVRAKYSAKVVKQYIPAIALGMFSIGCIYKSHVEMKARGAALAAAYNVLNEGFKFYRKNVTDEYGEEVDRRMFYGFKNKEFETTETDEDGNEVTTVKNVDVVEDVNPCAFIFARETSGAWRNDQNYNKSWVNSTQRVCQLLLEDRMFEAEKRGDDPSTAVVLLKEALDRLQIDTTGVSCVDGWRGGSIIDFRAVDIYKEAIHDGADQRYLEPAIALNFNCDGVVLDDLPSNFNHVELLKNYGKDA